MLFDALKNYLVGRGRRTWMTCFDKRIEDLWGSIKYQRELCLGIRRSSPWSFSAEGQVWSHDRLISALWMWITKQWQARCCFWVRILQRSYVYGRKESSIHLLILREQRGSSFFEAKDELRDWTPSLRETLRSRTHFWSWINRWRCCPHNFRIFVVWAIPLSPSWSFLQGC